MHFPVKSLSSLLFAIALMQLTCIHRECNAEHKFTGIKEKIKHFMHTEYWYKKKVELLINTDRILCLDIEIKMCTTLDEEEKTLNNRRHIDR